VTSGPGSRRQARVRQAAGRWAREDRAAAAVEFAIVLPVIALLYLGGFELFQASAVYHKMSDATREMANITAQNTSTTETTLCSLLSTVGVVLTPYSTTPLVLDLYEIQTDSNSNASVTWHVRYTYSTSTCLDVGAASSWTMPAGLATASSAYILAQSSYKYTLSVGANEIAAIPTLTDQVYFVPRESASVPCTSC
jgi:Flp pilus assembly protein TadG